MRTLNKNVPAHFFLDSIFNHSPKKRHVKPFVYKRIPHNIIKNEKGYALEFAIPGFSKDDFSIKMEENKLVVKLNSPEKENINYTRKEFDFDTFEKKFSIPNTINSEKISATYNSGILTVLLELKEKITKEINIH